MSLKDRMSSGERGLGMFDGWVDGSCFVPKHRDIVVDSYISRDRSCKT